MFESGSGQSVTLALGMMTLCTRGTLEWSFKKYPTRAHPVHAI